MTRAPDTFPRCDLNEDLMAQVVDLRARGQSWEDAARAIEWDVADLRRACRNDPGYNAAYEFAEREVAREDEARARRVLRKGLESPDPKEARRAAETLSKHLAAKRRDETRLEVERLRAEARQASAQARLAGAQAKQSKRDEEPELTPQQEKQVKDAFDRAQVRYAEEAVAECLPVYLWAGCHKLGGSTPDATDIPLVLVADSTVPGRTVYWAISATPPTHLEDGPFLSPPGKPI